MMTFREGLIIASIMFTVLLNITNGLTSTTKEKDACDVCVCQSKNEKVTVNCKALKLSTVPSGIPANVYKLDLSINLLRRIPELALQNPSMLEELYLYRNQLTFIGEDVFLQLTNLRELNIGTNQLADIDVKTLLPLKKLEILDLSGNRIKDLPAASFHHFYDMLALNLNNNSIADIPDLLLASMSKLIKLDMEQNHITEIRKPHFSNLEELQYLYLRGNKIHIIEKDSFVNLTSLVEIDLSQNILASIPEYVFISTTALQFLDLSHNSLPSLPTHLFSKTSQVREIRLSNNALNVIPKGPLCNLASTISVYLSSNTIKELNEDSFTYMSSLIYLFLDKNKISRLPNPIFRHLGELKHLCLEDNNLQELSGEIFSHLENLISLKLDRNEIHRIDPGVFSTLKQLNIVKLGSNKLEELPEKLLPEKTELSFLDLSSNRLEHLPKAGLGNVRRVSYLYMSKNKISSLPWNLFIYTIILRILDFSNNQLQTLPLKLFHSNNETHGLETLFLHRNQLRYLPKGIFRDLPKLTLLSLFHNNLQTLADDTFTGFGGGKVYLFDNKLTFLNHSSFNNDKISELHLYGNNITRISKMTLSGVSETTKVFIDCENIQELQDPDVKMICVTPTFVPIIQVDRQLGIEMGKDGFKCKPVSVSKFSCFPCTRGTFGNRTNGCIPCPPGGFYEDEIGTTINYGKETCKRCRNGTYVSNGGGKSAEDCKVCPDGTNEQLHAGYRACFCQDGYARVDRFGPCLICHEKGVDCTKREYKSLKHGFYWSWSFSKENLTNYKKFVENIKNTNGTFGSNTQYNGTIPRAFPCPRLESCNNTEGSVEVTCALGYKGWLCSKCEEKFYSVLNYCLICPKTELLYLQTALILSLFVIGCACLFRFHKRKQSHAGKSRSHIMDILISQGKIVLGFYQVIGELLTTLYDVNFSKTLKYIGDVISIIELNIFQLFVWPPCFHEKLRVNPKVKFLLAITYLVITVVVPIGIYHTVKVIHSKSKRRFTIDLNNNYVRRVKSNIVTFIIVTLFLTYPSICTTIFQIYPAACERFCLDVNNNTCKVLLRSDYEIECKDLNIYHIFAYIATAGYVVAYPAVLFYLLRKRIKELLFEKRHTSYKSMRENHDDEMMNITNKASCDDGQDDIWIDFFCESYKPQYWYWEILELTRKVTQTALITLLGWKNRLTILASIGVSVLFLTLHARFMPMKRASEQRLQLFSLAAILVNVVVAATDVPEDYEDSLSVALFILNVVILVIIIGEIVLGLLIRIRRTKLHTTILWFHVNYISSFIGNFRERFRQIR